MSDLGPAPERLLTRICMTMFADAFKLPYGQEILAHLLRQVARGAAQHALEFEYLTGLHDNLQAPSRYLADVMSGSLTVRGVEQVPARGPVLITCNHPGVFDAMVIFASLLRTDVKVIARAAAIWRKIEPKRDDIAVKGLENLKSFFGKSRGAKITSPAAAESKPAKKASR